MAHPRRNEEEGQLFPKMREGFGRSQLQELADAPMTAKKSAPTRPHPRSPDEPPGNILAAAATLPFDMAGSAGETAVRRVQSAARNR